MDNVDQIRLFNRTVTQCVGALETRFLGRNRPLGACRVLFEIGSKGIEIRELRDRLELDSGYVSRLVQSLEREGLVVSRPSASDARVRVLTLTGAGKRELSELDEASTEHAVKLLDQVNPKQRGVLLSAMGDVVRILTANSVRVAVEDPTTHAATRCIASYYEELATRFDRGFDPVKSISADPEELIPPNGYLLIAKLYGEPVGCGALKCHEEFAEIKRMWVDAQARGLGIGRRILQELEKLAGNIGIDLLRLETNKSLKEAQYLYRSSGYKEVKKFNDEPYAHHWFEKRLRSSSASLNSE